MKLNASQITHGLKVVGLGQSMVLGVVVIAVASVFLYGNRRPILDGFFG